MENKVIKITLWMKGHAFEHITETISDAYEALQGMRELAPDVLQNWTDDELMISLAEMAAGTKLAFSTGTTRNRVEVKRFRADQV